MYCRKCGHKINESDKFCQKCGTAVTVVSDSELKTNMAEETASAPEANKTETTETHTKTTPNTVTNKRYLPYVGVVVGVVAVFCIIFFGISAVRSCEWSDCHNPKTEGSRYCVAHTCDYSGCYDLAWRSDNRYCSKHGCSEILCNKTSIDGGSYCSAHTCKYPDCYEKAIDDYGGYCYKHNYMGDLF